MRRWGVYARDGFEGALAFRQGLLEVGESAELRSLSDWGPGCLEAFDAIVLFGLQGKGPQVRAAYRAAGVPVVLVDYGYLSRTHNVHDWRTGHWQVGLEELNALPPFACPPDRFEALGINVAERGGDPNGYVLLCVQTTGDATHGLNEDGLQAWCDLQRKTWPDLLLRPHPQQEHLTYGLPLCEAPTLREALAGARLVVTGNSNVGHDALIAGVPVVATFPGSAWGYLAGPRVPSVADRLSHFHRCAYGQWTWDEFRRGLPQRFLIDRIRILAKEHS